MKRFGKSPHPRSNDWVMRRAIYQPISGYVHRGSKPQGRWYRENSPALFLPRLRLHALVVKQGYNAFRHRQELRRIEQDVRLSFTDRMAFRGLW